GGKRSKLLEQPLKMNCPNEASLELPWTTKLKINLDINTESPCFFIVGSVFKNISPGPEVRKLEAAAPKCYQMKT
ncbi:hypothetical protein, partial [Pedobacter ghigonis]|uniref:hypothetical protein n=1 Tax=Pedobacter ghigonis TaxID=2730403 RepID=UPI001C3756CC